MAPFQFSLARAHWKHAGSSSLATTVRCKASRRLRPDTSQGISRPDVTQMDVGSGSYPDTWEQRSDGENSSEADLALNVVPSEKSGRDINRTRRKHHAHEETLAKDEGNFDSDEEQEDARLLEEASGAKIHAQHHAQEDLL
eukprot:s1101_g1.t1